MKAGWRLVKETSMVDNFQNDGITTLLELLADPEEHRDYAFTKRFERHVFFDQDVRSDDVIIQVLQDIALACLGPEGRIAVLSASDRSLLGWLKAGEAWSLKMSAMTGARERAGYHDGLLLIDDSKRFLVHQQLPIELGILAFDGLADWPSASANARECFFYASDFENWLSGATERDLSLTRWYGREDLAHLVKHYR